MAKPVPSGLPQNIFLSSAQLIANGVDVGLVSGVKVTIKEDVKEVKTDQLGTMPANHYNVGVLASGELTFDEFTPAQFKKAFPQASLVGTSPQKVSFGKQIGSDYFSIAQSLLFVPTSDDTAFAGRHLYLNKVAFMGDASIEYGPEKKITIKAKFQCYPDITQPSGQWIGYFGDPSAGSLVHAIAAAAVAGGGNAGNGTVSNEAANDTFTKTEVWTLACIKASVGGGIFSVTGSVTGARGNATVGTSYASNSATPGNSELLLKINAGGTDFVVGDSFTIATTAANFT